MRPDRGVSAAATGSASGVRWVEVILFLYASVTTSVALLRLSSTPEARWVVVANLLVLTLIMLLVRGNLGPVGRTLRELYPLLILPALYGQLDILSGFGARPVHDPAVQQWEAYLFGGQVSREWWQAHPSSFWSTILHGAYFAYYPIVVGPAVYFLFRGRLAEARRALRWVITTFVVCYCFFLFYPVAGPYYEFPWPLGPFVDNPMARLVYATLARGSAYGAAFPSSHVAAAIASTAAAFAGSKRLGLFLAIPTGLLTVGVVYCQMHYAVDAVAGALVGSLTALAVWRLTEAERAG